LAILARIVLLPRETLMPVIVVIVIVALVLRQVTSTS
jgi:hypothetical protein